MSDFSLMIIDDNADDRFILRRYLKKMKLTEEIFEAGNGKEALEFLQSYNDGIDKKHPPIILFLDLNMPIMDGFEFLKEYNKFRENGDAFKSVVIMTYSSSERPEDIEKCQSYEFVKNHIVKGEFEIESLRAKITESLP